MESRYYLIQEEIKAILKQLERLKYLIDVKDHNEVYELKRRIDELYKKYEF